MRLNPYLLFDGNCDQAMGFYESVLGGKLEIMRFGQAPESCGQMPPGNEHLVMHACLTVGDMTLMASDTMPSDPTGGMKGFAVALNIPAAAEAARVFDALSPGATITMALGETFWAQAFGMLTDRYGTPWIINGAAKKP